jgi:hypothetical protein
MTFPVCLLCVGVSAGQSLLPAGGAEIVIVPLAALHGKKRERTQRTWIEDEVRIMANGRAVLERVEGVQNDAISDTTRVTFDWERVPGEEPQHVVQYYFSLKGSLFKIDLSYWSGDQRGPIYEKQVLSLLNRIKPH